MRSIRAHRVRTQGVNLLPHPFQDSVLEIQLEKYHQCLLQIQKNHLKRAAQLLEQIEKHQTLLSLGQRDKTMMKYLKVGVRAYLLSRQNKQEQALKCLNEATLIQNRHDKLSIMRITLIQLIKSTVYCRVGKVEQCKELIKQCLELIKSLRGTNCHAIFEKSYAKYNKVFIIFLNLVIVQLSKAIEFEEVAEIYKEGYSLAQNFLGKSHKLSLFMHRMIEQNKKAQSLQSKKCSRSIKLQNSIDKYKTIKLLNSKKKLKVNENKILNLSTKEKEMKRIYIDDELDLSKLRLTRRDQKLYIKSLKKVKEIYNSSNGQYTKVRTDPNTQERNQTILSKMGQSGDFSRRRIKDIILRGRRLNKDMLYLCDSDYNRTYTQANMDLTSNTFEQVSAFANMPQQQPYQQEEVKVRPEQTATVPKEELTLANIAMKVQQRQQKKQACQII